MRFAVYSAIAVIVVAFVPVFIYGATADTPDETISALAVLMVLVICLCVLVWAATDMHNS